MIDNYDRFVGQILDKRYKIERVLGVGGMAVVFLAYDGLMKRPVAVKMLKDDIASDEQAVRRFINESKAVAMLSHPNIVNIYDVSVKENCKYIVMEYIEGITLKNYMTRRGPLSFRETVSYSEQILRALEHAHAKNIVHRDIKPQNIMLLKNGQIKVTDFGIAKLPDAETLTTTDKAIGTVYYISPEQASGKPIDQRSDLYALGVVMYEMATGRLPFYADSPISVALMQVNDNPATPRSIDPGIPQGLEQIILSAMEKNPQLRFESAAQMLRQLQRLRADPNIVFKPSRRLTQARRAEEKQEKARERRENHKPSRSMFPIIMGVAVALLLVMIVAGWYLIDNLIFADTSHLLSIKVPTATGNLYRAAEGGAEALGFDPRYYNVTVEYKFDPNSAPNTVIEQEPEAGLTKKVQANVQRVDVVLTVSRGAEMTRLGDYTIMESRYVEATLRTMGFVVKTETVYSDVVPVGYVASTLPAPGSVVNIGETVYLRVSRGENIKYILAPDFKGLSEVEAAAELKKSGLTLGTVTYKNSNRPAGTVLEQSITPYEQVAQKSTTVDFVVSGGPTYGAIEMPDLTGMSLEQARTALADYNLNLSVAGQMKSEVALGLIVRQNPPHGTDMKETDIRTVSVVISGGPNYAGPVIPFETDPAETTAPEEPIEPSAPDDPDETTAPNERDDNPEETAPPRHFPLT